MDNARCNVIYVDRAVSHDRYIQSSSGVAGKDAATWETAHIAENVGLLLDVFGEVHLCSTGGACLSQWLNLQDTSMVELIPTIILIDTPFQDRIPERSRSRTPSHHSPPDDENHEEELYGLALLQRIISESYVRNMSKLVVPVPVIAFPSADSPDTVKRSSDVREEIANAKLHPGSSEDRRTANRRMLQKCLELGATDVMASPMNGKCITNLEVHAYRAHRQAARDQNALMELRRGRKRSWVGISDEKPYAYLREAMVSGLMNGICRVGGNEIDDMASSVRISVSAEKHAEITHAVGKWHFCAHSFTDDELIMAAAVMFKHALAMPELEKWRLPTDQLQSFLIACRAAYNTFVPYHNFRHVVDVLQATFHFLVCIGALPPYLSNSAPPVAPETKSPIAALLQPFDALTLLITAIGHDVGHPGVNNGFLIALNAPLAQLYNDRSVLESFHCAAYSQILRRHWPAAFGDGDMRNLMISSILATDMGLHFDYMKKLGDLQDKLHANNSSEGWDARMIREQKALACALLIKCADISNVARRHDAALKWMHVLSEEFSRQAAMETELAIPTSLAAAPKKDTLNLYRAQLGFMNLFAVPLFQGVAEILPSMQYCADELQANKALFDESVATELEKERAARKLLEERDGSVSPKTMSLSASPEQAVEAQRILRELSPSAGPVDSSPSPRSKDSASQRTERGERTLEGTEMTNTPREVNGIITVFDAVADFARSDPFDINGDSQMQGPTKQRCSETTEGSSAPYTGDWASQATSATTGKMPLSPSTQGTSIVSRDSMDRPNSVPVTTITAPESTTTVAEPNKSQPDLKLQPSHQSFQSHQSHLSRPEEHESISFNSCYHGGMNGTPGKGTLHPDQPQHNCKTLKKKGSRFRINPFQIIKRHLSSSPPLHSADTAG